MGRKAPPTVSIAEFAEDHGKGIRTVQLWIKEGMPYRDQRGERRIVRADANRWLLERVKARAEPAGGDAPSEKLERARKTRAEADLKELDLRERLGTLVDRALYEQRLEEFLGGFTAVASGQLTRFERAIVKAQTPADARRLTREIFTALMQGAQGYADQIEAELTPPPDEPAAA